MPRKVAIVGGGITGLVAAYELERASDAEIDLFEASERLGGKIDTERGESLTIERGPDCFFARKAGVSELVADLGLNAETIAPERKEFAMFVGGELHRVPAGLVSLTDCRPEAVEETGFLSPEGKARALAEPEQPVGTEADESIRAFFTRRFGPEFSRLVAEPLLAGTHGGDADGLSMRALYPNYLELERRHGKLTGSAPASPEGKPAFLSFRGGMRTLIDALGANLRRTRVHLSTPVTGLSFGKSAEIRTDRFRGLTVDHLLLALPANYAARLVPPKLAEALAQIPHRSSAIVTFAFDRGQIAHPLEGTGFLVPSGEPLPITGATWSSQKWSGRAPEGTVLMRVFMRDASENDHGSPGSARMTDEEMIETALEAIRPLLGISGEPTLAQIQRWTDALPQYEIGHSDRLAAIDAATPRGLSLAGTSYRGVGVPDCVRQGREAARRILEEL